MDHDQLFKDLLTTFFSEFLELFFPEVAEELDRKSIQFLDKELSTDLGAGDRHEVDLIAKVRLRQQETFILIHVENQSTAQIGFPKRMFRYFSLLHRKFDLPIYPIAIFSYDKPLVPAADSYAVELFGLAILKFQFKVLQLNRLNWRDFLSRPNPVASALIARMRISAEDRLTVKLQRLRMLSTLRLHPAKGHLINTFMKSYLSLSAEEQVVYNREIGAINPLEKELVMEYVSEWEVEARIDIISRQLRRRFGDLPVTMPEQIRELPSEKLLDLAEDLLDFKTIDDVQGWITKAHLN